MKLKTWLGAMAAAAALGFVAVPAQAAPAGSLDALKSAASQTSDVQKAHWYGRRYGYRDYYYPRYRYDYGYRPGFRYYYGPRYHRRHWHYRYW
jgi:hypothetical protein